MNKILLGSALATLAIPSFAFAAQQAQPATDMHHQGMKHDGCCPEKKDGEKSDDCCKGMKCCDKMKPADKATAPAAAHDGHQMTK